MIDLYLRPYKNHDHDAYIAIYENSFPISERKPLEYMLASPQSHLYDLLTVALPSDEVVGLVILAYATYGQDTYALLDYLAISPKQRGSGLGHRVLPLVKEHCQRKGARMFLEIEDPRIEAENKAQRIKRKAFYLSCGLVECGVKADMYDTLMELMAYPEDAPHISFEVYRQAVRQCFPENMGLPIEAKQK